MEIKKVILSCFAGTMIIFSSFGYAENSFTKTHVDPCSLLGGDWIGQSIGPKGTTTDIETFYHSDQYGTPAGTAVGAAKLLGSCRDGLIHIEGYIPDPCPPGTPYCTSTKYIYDGKIIGTVINITKVIVTSSSTDTYNLTLYKSWLF